MSCNNMNATGFCFDCTTTNTHVYSTCNCNSFHPEARQSTAFLGALWAPSAQSMPRKAVDLDHMILNDLSFNLHSKFAKFSKIRY